MAVIRGNLEAGNFFVMRRLAIEDERLSLKAKGLLAYLLSKPPGWQVSTSQLAAMGPDGKDAVGAAMKELVMCGYSAMVEKRRMGGTYGYDYIITDDPSTMDSGLSAVTGKTVNGKSATSNNDGSKNNPPVSPPRGTRAKRKGMTKPEMEAHEKYPLFQSIWSELPQRLGSDPKVDAFQQFLARLKEGVDPEVIRQGALRYAEFCDATGKTGTETVMQGKRFFGREYEWEQGWEVPSMNGKHK